VKSIFVCNHFMSLQKWLLSPNSPHWACWRLFYLFESQQSRRCTIKSAFCSWCCPFFQKSNSFWRSISIHAFITSTSYMTATTSQKNTWFIKRWSINNLCFFLFPLFLPDRFYSASTPKFVPQHSYLRHVNENYQF
jgi:hypothetical protein